MEATFFFHMSSLESVSLGNAAACQILDCEMRCDPVSTIYCTNFGHQGSRTSHIQRETDMPFTQADQVGTWHLIATLNPEAWVR